MIGRHVTSTWHKFKGVVLRWEPLGSAMCDVLVQRDDGSEVWWFASSDLKPTDDLGPLPCRHEARERVDREALASLKSIRASLVAEWNKPWPGAEHGKSIVGQALDGAINEVETRLKRASK